MSTPARGAKWKNFAAKPGKSVTAHAYAFCVCMGEGRAVKRFLCILLFLLFLPMGAGEGAAAELSVAAKGAVLIDAQSGRVLFGQNENERFPMASTTKIMTALLALENCSLDEEVTASENASGVPGTSIYLGVGETLTMEEMLYGLLLRSGNDAAVAIAEHVAGSVEAFAARMNARAAELGADAHFVNPHGLDADGHEASALALARIFRQAMQSGDFRRITGTQRATIPWVGNDFSRVLVSKNRLLTTYAGATGGKTGYTSDAGRCLVFSAEREGMELIGVVLSCPNWFDEAGRMLDWGFENYRLEAPLSAGELACEAAVEGGMADAVTAVAEGGLAAAVGEGEAWRVEYDFPGGVRAPVVKGEAIGTATLYIEGTPAAQTALLAGEDVESRGLASALKRLFTRWALLFAT